MIQNDRLCQNTASLAPHFNSKQHNAPLPGAAGYVAQAILDTHP
jgi:hypothetical protein